METPTTPRRPRWRAAAALGALAFAVSASGGLVLPRMPSYAAAPPVARGDGEAAAKVIRGERWHECEKRIGPARIVRPADR